MARNILTLLPPEKRYHAVEFSGQQEIINGETLTGTPTVVADVATALTLSLNADGTSPGIGLISGTQVRFWITATGAAALGDRRITVIVSTSGGASLKEVCTLSLAAQ